MSRRSEVLGKGGDVGSRKRWSWLHFAFGFLAVGLLLFSDVGMPFFHNFWPHLVETMIVATICGVLAARFGDVAFEKILKALRWW
jgi:hypothetical protein